MRFAYADPPYLGKALVYDHPEAARWNDLETHRALIQQLQDEFPDGWCLSMGAYNLRDLLPLCPPDVRIGAWVKEWTSSMAFIRRAWEPFVWRGGRKLDWHGQPTTRDWIMAAMNPMQPDKVKGFYGQKPIEFCRHVLVVLGVQPGDEVVDLFPGTGTMGRAVAERTQPMPLWRQSELLASP